MTEYHEGYADGVIWAENDRKEHMPPHEELARLREESQSDARWQRAFYLGALRGYRSVVRTLRDGKWGT